MSEKFLKKFRKISEGAVKSNVKHLVLVVTDDKKVHIEGSNNLVNAIIENEDVHESLKTIALDENRNESERYYVFDRLPFPPSSPMWKRSSMIRSTLSKMLNKMGVDFCGSKKVHGQGSPPKGWPDSVIPWSDFKGPSKSHLNNQQLTRIIIEILKAHGIDPETFVEYEAYAQTKDNTELVAGLELEVYKEIDERSQYELNYTTDAQSDTKYVMEVCECDIMHKVELESDMIVTVGEESPINLDDYVDVECSIRNMQSEEASTHNEDDSDTADDSDMVDVVSWEDFLADVDGSNKQTFIKDHNYITMKK